MNYKKITLVLLASLSVLASAQASEFDGMYVGVKAGSNKSDITSNTAANAAGSKSTTTWGIDEGYNWDMDGFLLGADFFVDANHKADHTNKIVSYSSSTMGLGLKLGVPLDSWLPYAHIGYAKTKAAFLTYLPPGNGIGEFGVTGGVGIEYKLAPNWSVNAELSRSSASNNGSKLNNDNATIGIRYYLNVPAAAPIAAPVVVAAAPAPAPVPAPVVAKPAPAPAPEPAPVVAAPVPAPVAAKAAPAPMIAPAPKPVPVEKIVRLEGANFATGSAKLLKAADAKLNEVVNAAKQYPEANFVVSGHTDSRGKKASNQKLSEHRAAAVKAYLVAHGVAANRISTAGYADSKPAASNDTVKGRAENRRVEVKYAVKEVK